MINPDGSLWIVFGSYNFLVIMLKAKMILNASYINLKNQWILWLALYLHLSFKSCNAIADPSPWALMPLFLLWIIPFLLMLCYQVSLFLTRNQKPPKKYILVHCTHGHNRTGYMIIHYLMRTQTMSVTQVSFGFIGFHVVLVIQGGESLSYFFCLLHRR